MRRSLSALLVGVLAMSLVAAVAPGDVTAELSPPTGQTAVTFNQELRFGGEVPVGSSPSGTLEALGAGDAVLGTFNVSNRLSVGADGAVSGSVLVGCFYIPECFSNPDPAARRAAIDALQGYRLVLAVEGVSDVSNIVDFDDEPPIITSYALTSPTTVLVRFSEDVVDPDGDSAADWLVDGLRQVTSVAGSGNSRVLTFLAPQGNDETPEVRYLPTPSVTPRVPNVPYSDGARNELDAANRFALAADRIPPPVPSIATIDGSEVTYAAEDEANPVLGNAPSPVVVVEDVPEGDTAQLFLDDGDGNFEPNGDDQLVGEATGDAAGQATITVTASLPDDVHRFYAHSQDTALCDPNEPSLGQCANTSGRSQEAMYDLETVPPVPLAVLGRSATITVRFSEAVAGTDAPDQWTIDNGAGPAAVVTGVSGTGDRRVLEYSGGPLLAGAELTWSQPGSGAYADEHSNLLETFTAVIDLPPLPVVDVVGTDATEGNPTFPPLPGDDTFVTFVVELSDELPPGEMMSFEWETVPGLDGDAVAGDDYVAASGSGTISGSDTSDPIEIEIERDVLDEFDETVFLRVFDVVGATVPGGDSLIAGAAIVDDDAVVDVALATDTVDVTEGGAVDVTVSLAAASGKPVSVDWSTVLDGTADVSDVPAQSGTVVIPAGDTSATFSVSAADDDEDEADETLSLTLANPVNSALGDPSTATLTVLDNDLPTLSVAAGFVGEDDVNVPGPLGRAPLRFELRLSNPADGDLEVPFETIDGSAVAGADYDARNGSITIEAGDTVAQVVIDVRDDELDEFDETVGLVVSEVAGAELAGGGSSITALGTIIDDEVLPTIAFASGSASEVVDEGDSATLTVELNTASGRDVLVDWTTRYDGSATDADAPTQSGTILIPAGETSATIDVATTQDDEFESDETFQVDLVAVEDGFVELADDRPTTSTITIADDEVVLPTLTVSGGSVDEGALAVPPLTYPQLVWTFTLSEVAETDVTVEVRTAPGGDATAEDDYIAKAGTVVIEAGDLSADFPVSVLDDELDEFDETVLLLASDPSGARLEDGVQEIGTLGTITDDDPVVTVSLAGDETVTEGNPATFTVALDDVSGKDVTVSYATADGTATAGDDYVSTSGELTIPAGEQTGTFTVPTRDDADDEPNETVTVSIDVVTTDSAALGTSQVTLTINDDDVVLGGDPVLSLSGTSVEEGSPSTLPFPPDVTTMTFELGLSEPASADVVVDWATSAGTATADRDYAEATGQATIEQDQDSATIEVAIARDAIDEFDEDLVVTITGVTGPAQLPDGGLARTGVITDDDAPATIAFADDTTDLTVGEGDTATFTVELVGETEKPVAVEYATSYDGAATTDDAPSQTGTVDVPVGATTATFTIATTEDDDAEGDESLSVVLSSPTNATLDEGRTTVATLTIVDDEVTLPTLTVDGGTVDESDGLPPLIPPRLVWTFTLSKASPVDVMASYRTTSTGSATPGADFTGTSGTITIEAGDTTFELPVDVVDDTLDEFIEEVPLVVSDVVNAVLPGGVERVTELGRITDDDPLVVVSLGDDVTVTEGEPATIDIVLDTASGKDVRVRYATRDDGATAGDDYTETVGELTIPAGDMATSFTVPTRDDLADEPDEKVAIDLTVLTPDAAEPGRTNASLTIEDDDLPIDPSAPPVVGLSGDTVDEGDPIGPLPLPTPMTFEVRLSRPAEGDVTLAWETRPDTATAGEDFTADSGSVTVPDGDDTAEVTIDVLPDLIDEFDEDLVLALTSVTAGSATIPGDELTRRGRILDDDPLASLGFDDASIDIGVTEGGTVELTVELTGATEKSVSVDYAVSFDGGATSADAPAQSGTLDLPAGTTTATFPITTLQDDLDEPNEAFSVVLSDATGATIDAARRVATVTIADDDLVVPVLSVVGGDVDEGAAGTPLSGFAPLGPAPVPGLEEPLVFTVTLSEPAEVDVLVDWATTDLGTAVAGSDYAAASGTLTIPAGETSATVEIDVFDDDLDEFDEVVVVRFSNVRNARFGDGGSRLDQSGRITDDDPLVTVALGDDVEVAEGDPATFDVTLSAASGKDVRVRLSTEDGAARSGADYRATTTTLTIPAGETAATFTVPTFDDSIVEPTEDATVRLEVVDADTAELGRSAATLSITDDDVPTDPDAVVVSLSGDAVEEGDPFVLPLPLPGGSTLAFVIRLSAPAEGDVTIDYETRAGTATAGDDFTAVQGEITIPDGSSEATIEVPVIPDTLDEFDEDLTLALTGVRGDAVLPGGELERTGRILDDDDAAQLRVNDATVLEGSTAELDVTLNTASGKDITVDYRFVDGTATAGADYVATSGTLTFPAGTTSRSVEVATLADTDTGELIEQFELVLSAPTNAALDDPRGTVSIVDIGVDGLPTVTAVFLEDITTVEADGDRTALVPVRLSAESAEDVTVTWSTQQLTATDGEDYRAEGGQVVIPAGATSAQIPVTIIGDDEVEPNEDFLVLLTAAEGAVITGPTGRVTIEDDDAEDDGGPGGGGGDGAPDGEDDGAVGADDEGDLAATGGGAGFVVFGLGLLAARRRRREDD